MNEKVTESTQKRQVCFVLSARSLSYAGLAFTSLTRHAREPLQLVIITDGAEDKARIETELKAIEIQAQHGWHVYTQADADDRAKDFYATQPHICAFRKGHPCWRKITDPLLFTPPRKEVIILDPDVYFPNYFTFESTPAGQLLLMWQKPHCLLPEETVTAAYKAGVRLAHHTDIGIAQFHNSLDLDWLDWLIRQLGGEAVPREMHVESIIWAGLAMRMGGGYLDPRHWRCWRNSQHKRVMMRLGYPGRELLKSEPFRSIKCFHAGGVAKWWLREAHDRGYIGAPTDLTAFYQPKPFEELAPQAFHRGQLLKRFIRRLGYYKLFPTKVALPNR